MRDRRSHRWGVLSLLVGLDCGCSLTADLDSLTEGTRNPSKSRATDDTDESSSSASGPSSTSGCSRCESSELDGGIISGETLTPSEPTPSVRPYPPSPTSEVDPSSSDFSDTPTAPSSSPDTSGATCDDAHPCAIGPLIHRYSFSDISAGIVDEVGNAHGVVIGQAVQGEGRMILDAAAYGELPNTVLEGLRDFTLEVWFTSYRTRVWERIFDFGEAANGSGKTYLFFTSQVPSANGTMRFAVRPTGDTERVVNTTNDTTRNVETHIAVVFDDTNDRMLVYHDGELSGSAANDTSLNQINIVHSWLGRSMYSSDPGFEGEFNEFRVYDAALDADDIRRSFNAGPDHLPD